MRKNQFKYDKRTAERIRKLKARRERQDAETAKNQIALRNRNYITAADVMASAPKAYGVTPENFRPQLTPIKDIMKFANE